jgi:hypothetical protein
MAVDHPTEDLVTRLRKRMKHSAAYSVRENESRLVAIGNEAADEIERLRNALRQSVETVKLLQARDDYVMGCLV